MISRKKRYRRCIPLTEAEKQCLRTSSFTCEDWEALRILLREIPEEKIQLVVKGDEVVIDIDIDKDLIKNDLKN